LEALLTPEALCRFGRRPGVTANTHEGDASMKRFTMARRFGALLPLCLMVACGASAQNEKAVTERLERLAASTSHFATGDIVRNGHFERRWPEALKKEQEDLAAELKSLGGERDALTALLRHVDPKVRTLAMGALFMREDPRDLPPIAALREDDASTFTLLRESTPSSTPFRNSFTHITEVRSLGIAPGSKLLAQSSRRKFHGLTA
jgi:hypothetical protein